MDYLSYYQLNNQQFHFQLIVMLKKEQKVSPCPSALPEFYFHAGTPGITDVIKS